MREQDADPREGLNQDPDHASPHAPPHVSRITTQDADEHHAWVSARYTDHERRVRARAQGFEFVTEFAALGSLTTASTRYKAAAVETSWPPVPFLTIGHLQSGHSLMRWEGGEVRLSDRGTALAPPYGFMQLHDCPQASAITVRMDTLLRVAEETTGLDRSQVRFTGLLPLTPAAERQWLVTADYIQRGIYTLALGQPLILAAVEQVVAANVLTTFPNTAMTIEPRAPRDAASAAAVRRATAFIDANASFPIALSDIAAAAGVTPRTLRYAFRRHRDTTPFTYLRWATRSRPRPAVGG
jgi:hypothetical protein